MDFIQHLLPSIEHLGILGYWLAFFASFFESMAIVGSFVPGAFIVVVFGFFSAQGYLDLGDLIWFVALGAILGDSVSYYLGGKGAHFFKNENRLLRRDHLDKGQAFFKKHGDKSIFLGRFIGPLRSIVPFIAGLSRMNMRAFLFWNVVSGFLWASAHLLLGYFFSGTLDAIGVWTGRVGLFVAGVVIFTFILWLLIKKSHPFWRFIKSISLSVASAIVANQDVQRLIKKYPRFVEFLKTRLNRKEFKGLPLTVLSVAFLYALFSFGGLVQDIIASDPIIALDTRLADLLYAFRDVGLIQFFLWITLLGKWQVVAVFAFVSSLLLWMWKKRIYIFSLWLTIIGSEIFVYLGKILIDRPRPGGYIPFYHEASLSFPSGHAAISIALYGFLTYILWKQLHLIKTKTTVLFIGISTIFFIGLSRMYLGVHFLSDVLGGYLAGALWLIVGITVTEWYLDKREIKSTQIKKVVKIISPIIIVMGVTFYVAFGFMNPPIQNIYTPTYQTQNGTVIADLFEPKGNLPKFSEGLIGEHQEPISFIFVAKNDSELISTFQKSGWYRADAITIATVGTLVKTALFKEPYVTAPMTPSFWNAKVHDFGFEKPTGTDTVRERHHVRVWKTNVETNDGRFIYVATASLDIGLKWFITHTISPDIDTERELLFSDIESTGLIIDSEKISFVDPVLGQNFTGDPFFTDGKSYIIKLK